MVSLLASSHRIEVLSLFWFIIAPEGLDDMLKTAQKNIWIKSFKVSNRVGTNIEMAHFLYADDTLVLHYSFMMPIENKLQYLGRSLFSLKQSQGYTLTGIKASYYWLRRLPI